MLRQSCHILPQPAIIILGLLESNCITPQIACFVENHIIPKEPHQNIMGSFFLPIPIVSIYLRLFFVTLKTGLLVSAHPEMAISGFALSAISFRLSAKDIKNK